MSGWMDEGMGEWMDDLIGGQIQCKVLYDLVTLALPLP